jgi:hypothetical protein
LSSVRARGMQRRMEDLSGRVAVVIGGGSGIGRGIRGWR